MNATDINSNITTWASVFGIIVQSVVTILTFLRKTPDEYFAEHARRRLFSRFRSVAKQHPAIFWTVYLSILLSLVFVIFWGCRIAPSVTITSPANNQRSDPTLFVRGRYRNIDPSGRLIWLAVYSDSLKWYFLQPAPAEMYDDHTWNDREVGIGTSDTRGQRFQILALLVDLNGSIYTAIKENVASTSYNGQAALPNGCRIMDKVTVIRN